SVPPPRRERQLRQPGRGDPARRRRDHGAPRARRAPLPPDHRLSGISKVAAMTGCVVIGAIALVAGLALLVTGIRKHKAQHPKHVAMLIGRVTLTAFGLARARLALE